MTSTTLPRSELTPNIHAWRGGVGPHLVLIHGVGLSADTWQKMLPHLTPRFSVTAIDMPGHGDSPLVDREDEPTLATYAGLIGEALEKIGEDLIVVGHSMGALLAMELAIRFPDRISAAIPLNAIFRRTEQAANAVRQRAQELSQGGQADVTATLERWFGNNPTGNLADANEHCKAMLLSANPIGYAAAYSIFAQSDGPDDNALRGCSVPMLFITGSDEPNSTPDMSHALAATVGRASSVIIEGARHMMPMTHAGTVSQNIIDFAHQHTAT